MVLRSRREYLEAIRLRYHRSSKKDKAVILDEFCSICGYNRKYAIRLLRKKAGLSSRKRPGPRSIYDNESLLNALKRIWFATDQMCSKKLKAAIPLWLPFYELEHEPLAVEIRNKLLAASPATIDRLLKPLRSLHMKGRCGTKPGTLLKNQISVKTHNWDVTRPGFFEADTVAHCGNSMAGDFVHSLTFTDIFSGWTENRAVWGKGSQGVLREIRDIEAMITFPILGFDCDNGLPALSSGIIRRRDIARTCSALSGYQTWHFSPGGAHGIGSSLTIVTGVHFEWPDTAQHSIRFLAGGRDHYLRNPAMGSYGPQRDVPPPGTAAS